MMRIFRGRRAALLVGALSWVLAAIVAGPVGRSAPPAVPADLAAGYIYESRLPWPASPLQAVYDPTTGDVVGMDPSGNVSVFAPAAQGYQRTRTIWQVDPENDGPDLVASPQGGTVYWLNPSQGTVEALSLTDSGAAPITVATDSADPQFLTVGPRGDHLYIVDGNGLSVVNLSAPGTAPLAVPLAVPADAPAAVYATATGDAVFLPSAVPSGSTPGGQILRLMVGPGAGATALPPLSDPRVPTALAVSPDGTVSVIEGYSDTLTVIANPLSASASGTEFEPPASPPAEDALALAPGSLFAPAGECIALGTDGAHDPVAMVYAIAPGTWQITSSPAIGPWAEAGGAAVSPTGGSGVILARSSLATEPLTGVLPALLPAAPVQIAADSNGSVWIPTMTGAVSVDPNTLAPAASVDDPASPTGGIALTANGIALADSNPARIALDSPTGTPQGTLSLPGGDIPLALASTAGEPDALVSEPSGAAGFWDPAGGGAVQALPFAASNLAASAAGPVAVGANALMTVDRPALLTGPAFTGPATPLPGGLMLAGSGFASSLALVDPAGPALLGSVPWVGTPADSGPLAGLALLGGGSQLVALTSQGILRYRGPSLTLSAEPEGDALTIGATLTQSTGSPAAGVPVTFSTGSSATTDAGGVATLELPLPNHPVTITATAPGVSASVTWSPATANPGGPSLPSSPAPPSGGMTAPRPAPVPPPHRGTGWRVYAVAPPHRPSPSVRLVHAGPSPTPTGTVLARFQVGLPGRSLYPGRYRLIVVPPARFSGRFGVWYWSAVADRWFPLMPSRWSRVFSATMPYLTAMAVTSTPVPAVTSLDPPNRRALAQDVAAMAFPAGSQRALLVNQGIHGAAPVDAFSAAPLAFRLNLPVLLSPADHLPAGVLKTLARLGARKVTLVGGTKALTPGIAASLRRAGIRFTQPFSGINRQATRAMIQARVARLALPFPSGSFSRARPDRFPDPPTAAPTLIWRGRAFTPRTLRILSEITWSLYPRDGSVAERALAQLTERIRQLPPVGGNPLGLARAYARLGSSPAGPPLVEIDGAHHSAAVALGQVLALRYNALAVVTKSPFPVPLTRFGIPRRPLWVITVGPFGPSGYPLVHPAPSATAP